jgi:hypothetical protein
MVTVMVPVVVEVVVTGVMPQPEMVTGSPDPKPVPVTVVPPLPEEVDNVGPVGAYAKATLDAPKTRPNDNSPPAINFIAR